MVSSRWQKHDLFIRNVGLGVTFCAAILLALLASLQGEGQGVEMVGMAVAVLGIWLSLAVGKRYAKSMIRVLKFDYEEIERDFRLLFKENNIRFSRKMEASIYRYDFFGHSLSMTVEPYGLMNLGLGDGKSMILPATQITLGKLDAKNQAFADKLANLIDEMANQLPAASPS